jgi:Ca2+-binding EF-hand superfamily protein
MKTIPVSFLVAGILLPAVCLAQTPAPPQEPPAGEKEPRRAPPRPFAEFWKSTDLDQDGFISKDEFAKIPRIQKLPEEKRDDVFKRLDKDADGKLSRDELERLGKPRDGQGPPLKRLWELDIDKSGGISLEEFKKGPMIMKLSPEKQLALFHRLDTDGDGVITPKDRPEPPLGRPEGKRPHPKSDPDHVNRDLDLNGDGALSFGEFRQGPAMKKLTEDEQEARFLMLDRNGDHKISAEDFPPKPPREEPAPPPPMGVE